MGKGEVSMRKYFRGKQKTKGDTILLNEQRDIQIEHSTAALLTVGAAAKYLGMSRKTIYQLIEMGQITPVKVAGATLVKKKSLDEFRAAGIIT
jgi:excisionase family DNA binding protein